MDIRLGAPVSTVDGRRVGRVSRVVVAPATGQVTNIVVTTGGIASRDLVAHRTAIEQASTEGVALLITADQVSELPDLVETTYVPLASRDRAPLITWEGEPFGENRTVLMPAATLYNPAVSPYAPHIVEEQTNVPANSTIIAENTSVIVAGVVLGTVTEVLAEPGTGVVREFIVSSGEQRWVVPSAAIASVGKNGIKISRAAADRIGEVHPPGTTTAGTKLKAELKETQERVKSGLEATRREAESKLAALKEQAASDQAERKQQLENRLEEAQADHKARTARMRRALEHSKKGEGDRQ